jgi:hypothetical protein
MPCSVHHIINSQTFSLAEMEFLVCHAETFKVCAECRHLFGNRIRAIQTSGTVFDHSLFTGKTGKKSTVAPCGDKRKRRS